MGNQIEERENRDEGEDRAEAVDGGSITGSRPKTGSAGSLTQWLLGRPPSKGGESGDIGDSSDTAGFCPTCGMKRKVPGVGSLTQWIFQSHLCQCQSQEAAVLDPGDALEGFEARTMPGFKTDEIEEDVDESEAAVACPADFPLQRYRLVRELGGGATGSVYLAIDRHLGKRVAIKLLRVSDQRLYVSFQNEARAISRVKHGGIIEVYDFSTSESGAPYMVMEYFPGISLRKLLEDRGSLPEAEALPIFTDLAGTMAHAHEKGIFHRDLKPDNVLVSRVGGAYSVKIVDFGLSRILKEESLDDDSTGSALSGTPLYMAPDMIAGHEFSALSEIYSLGTMMFEVLCGRLPFEGDNSLALLALKGQQAPPSLLEFCESKTEISPAVADIVTQTLQPNPSDRIQSMSELEAALSNVLASSESAVGEGDGSLSAAESQSLPLHDAVNVFGITAGDDDRAPFGPLSTRVLALLAVFCGGLALCFVFFSMEGGFNLGTSRAPGGQQGRDFEFPEIKVYDKMKKKVGGKLGDQPVEFVIQGMNTVDQEHEFSPEIIAHLNRLKGLYGERVVRVKGRKIGASDIEKFRRQSTVALEVPECDLDSSAYKALSAMTELRYLNLSGCNLKDRSLGFLKPLKKLERINLATTGVKESELRILSQLPALYSIYMPNSNLSNKAIDYFVACSGLRMLTVNGNNINVDGLMKLQDLDYLDSVACFRCSLKGSDRKALRRAMPLVDWQFYRNKHSRKAGADEGKAGKKKGR